MIWIVLDHRYPMAVNELHQMLAACPRQRHAAWILKVRLTIDHLWFPSDHPLESIDLHSAPVRGHTDELCLVRVPRLQRRQIGGRFHDHGITWINQYLADQIEPLL